ncbi:aarF domain containing kinase 2-like [Strongylocentrotus purpuratus]|uniref:ABC1 atypical kinase-like domain-containing protein n=1 Tax=Strongylocentrotus purpuratus TaxID=7668 RepID=A0A7M6UEC7_STRPU|nr:aarF domain containing kinase 2-like [Strongylocentrotus purpuratus]|eukprot:NP_001229590.1 aarF domain containing kinase 2-like [Strongylocentrotus purpuratus]
MFIHHISRITLQLRRVRPLHWTVLKRLPQPKYHPTKSVALTVCCAFIGVASYKRLPQILFSRAACQEAVLDHPVLINSEIDRLHSVKSLLVGQMRLWHHVLRTLASNLVQFVLVSLRYIRNSILFGPLLFSYPLVLLFPDRLQDVWLRALLRSIELSGPTFIKLGQWASTRRDLFSQDFCDQLSKLHRNAPSHSVEYTKRALEHAFGLLGKEIFRLESGNETVYSGCVGQVHKAYMRPDVYQAVMKGREGGLRDWRMRDRASDPIMDEEKWIPVAVKVLHPGIYESVHLDLRIINVFARILNLIPGLHWLSPVDLVDEFESLMKNQINLKLEAENLERFHQNFSKVPHVRIPQPVWPFVTNEILVETFESGQSISAFISCDPDNPDEKGIKKILAQMGVDVILKMVFVDNFVHADLHPGNILVQGVEEALVQPSRTVDFHDHITEFQVYLKEPKNPIKLVLLDTGITSHLEERDFNNFYKVFTAIVLRKGDVVAELFAEHASSNECNDVEKFKADMKSLVEKAHERSLQLSKMQVGQLLRELFALMIHHKVKLESNFASIILAIMVLEGLGRSLDPNLDILKAAKPVLLGR